MGREARARAAVIAGLRSAATADPGQPATKAEVRLDRDATLKLFDELADLVEKVRDAVSKTNAAPLVPVLETVRVGLLKLAVSQDALYAGLERVSPESRP
jgi:hypothetical protein